MEITINQLNHAAEPQTSIYVHSCFNWMVPNHSKSLHTTKMLFHQTSMFNELFGVPGVEKGHHDVRRVS